MGLSDLLNRFFAIPSKYEYLYIFSQRCQILTGLIEQLGKKKFQIIYRYSICAD